jgi:ribosomal-protein-serine acetyltransferase
MVRTASDGKAIMIEPVLAHPRMLLRRFRDGDEAQLYDAVMESMADLHPWMPWVRPQYSREAGEAWVASRPAAWEQGEEYSFAIFDPTGQHFLGGCALNRLDRLHGTGNLGYWVRTSVARRGVASTAAYLTAHYGFREMELQRIEIVAAVDNLASLRVARKIGATREGVLRARIAAADGLHDAEIWSLLPGEEREP